MATATSTSTMDVKEMVYLDSEKLLREAEHAGAQLDLPSRPLLEVCFASKLPWSCLNTFMIEPSVC